MKLHRISILILCLAILLSLMPMQTFALEDIDPQQDIRLVLSFQAKVQQEENGPETEVSVVGAPFQLFLLATADELGNMTPSQQFAGYPVDLKNQDEDYWEVLASTLQGYILRDGLTPVDQGVTDETGFLTFPTGEVKLVPGLYLVLGTRYVQDKIVYTCDPMIYQLPMLDKEADAWDYEVEVFAKYTATPDEPKTTYRKVMKLWEDEGFEEHRPDAIEVQLLCDGVVYDTVTLSEENDWMHTWKNLEENHIWSVVESAGNEDYVVEITLQGVTFVIVNRPDPDIPTEPTEPTEPEPPPDIPDTGLVWWPVPLMLAAGMFLILLGAAFRRMAGFEDEEYY
ncbi:MAG: Cna B-type domain-containing protein [Oscillospiraceae bacterium]|nr:Cna B-type domain-containing protein [Oscillospiraceae bacterium]